MTTVKKDRIWQRGYIRERREQIHRQLLQEQQKSVQQMVDAKIRQSRSAPSHQANLDALLFPLIALSDENLRTRLSDSSIYLEHCESVLRRQNIDPTKSRLKHLHDEIARIRSLLCDRPFAADWHKIRQSKEQAEVITGQSFDLEEPWNEGLNELPSQPSERDLAYSGLALKHRFREDFYKSVAQCLISKDFNELAIYVRQNRKQIAASQLLEIWLWTQSLRSKAFQNLTPKLKALKIRATDAADQQLWQLVNAIELARNGKKPLPHRIASLDKLFTKIDQHPDLVQRTLCWATLSRWLVRVKRPNLASLCQARYNDHCIRLSLGRSNDVFALFANNGEEKDLKRQLRFSHYMQEPPKASWREIRLLAMAFRIIYISARRSIKFWRSSQKDRLESELQDLSKQIAIAVDCLGSLKGPAMKIGQMLTHLGFQLPKEAEESLRTLTDSSPAMDPAIVRSIVEAELGSPVTSVFDEWEDLPIATGSMGQVHRAKLKTGEPVAVKVQYPNLEKLIKRDTRALRMLGNLIQPFSMSFDVRGLIEEVTSKLQDETDYLLEAEQQKYFYQKFKDHQRIAIPEVYQASKRVIITEYIDGKSLGEFCRTATQAQRNTAGQTILEWVVSNVLRDNLFQTDHNPGNFLFKDDKIYFLDFGSVKKLAEDDWQSWQKIISSAYYGSKDLLKQGMVELGMLPDQPYIDFDQVYENRICGVLQVASKEQDFEQEFTQEHVANDILLFALEGPSREHMNMPRESVMVTRNFYGFWGTLALIGARNNWRKIFADCYFDSSNPNERPVIDYGAIIGQKK